MTRVDSFADLDTGRQDRTGIPEVVLAEGKTVDQIEAIVRVFLEKNGRAIVSRLEGADCRLLEARGLAGTYHREARVAVYATKDFVLQRHGGVVAILAAGTSDLPVAEEARIVAEALGCEVVTRYDVGVAGLHRLLSAVERLRGADVYVAVAGREGALAPVVAGLVDKPVIGLPVSTGYGKGGAGEAALLSMLQSCAPLVTVNIDAGFVAGACAAQIARMVAEARRGVKS